MQERSQLIEKAILLINLLNQCERVSIRRISQELGITRSSAYRWVAVAVRIMPVRIEQGVVIHLKSQKNQP